ncbi:MAG: hypothetical protein R2771_13415 [Saprospiraceae bacterium]
MDNLNPDIVYSFQYNVDGEILIGDPYSEYILDPDNDKYISNTTFPDLKEYPEGKTSEIVSTFTTNQLKYEWQDSNFTAPAKEDLIIYELWIDDFIASHDYQTMADTLNYFSQLGVNAIELMPVNEFEGNISWGYNPSYHYALDKYYRNS